MLRTMMIGGLHRVTTTAAEVDYFGSCAIEAPGGSEIISVNGSAARRARDSDILILAAFGQFTEIEAKTHSPQVIFVNQHNQITTKAEATGLGVMTDPVPNP